MKVKTPVIHPQCTQEILVLYLLLNPPLLWKELLQKMTLGKIFEDRKCHILKLKVSKCTYIVLALIPMYGNPNYHVLSLNRVTSVGPRTVKISRVYTRMKTHCRTRVYYHSRQSFPGKGGRWGNLLLLQSHILAVVRAQSAGAWW